MQGTFIKAGDAWFIKDTPAGTIGPNPPLPATNGDLIIALTDQATNDHTNWLITSNENEIPEDYIFVTTEDELIVALESANVATDKANTIVIAAQIFLTTRSVNLSGFNTIVGHGTIGEVPELQVTNNAVWTINGGFTLTCYAQLVGNSANFTFSNGGGGGSGAALYFKNIIGLVNLNIIGIALFYERLRTPVLINLSNGGSEQRHFWDNTNGR